MDGDNRIDSLDACPIEDAISNDGRPIAQYHRGVVQSEEAFGDGDGLDEPCGDGEDPVQRTKGRSRVRVASKSLATVGNKATVTAKRLKPGAHRVKVSISSSGGAGTARTKSFRVR